MEGLLLMKSDSCIYIRYKKSRGIKITQPDIYFKVVELSFLVFCVEIQKLSNTKALKKSKG